MATVNLIPCLSFVLMLKTMSSARHGQYALQCYCSFTKFLVYNKAFLGYSALSLILGTFASSSSAGEAGLENSSELSGINGHSKRLKVAKVFQKASTGFEKVLKSRTQDLSGQLGEWVGRKEGRGRRLE